MLDISQFMFCVCHIVQGNQYNVYNSDMGLISKIRFAYLSIVAMSIAMVERQTRLSRWDNNISKVASGTQATPC